jgi:hypothetical protein
MRSSIAPAEKARDRGRFSALRLAPASLTSIDPTR